jgi:hypothetical protein
VYDVLIVLHTHCNTMPVTKICVPYFTWVESTDKSLDKLLDFEILLVMQNCVEIAFAFLTFHWSSLEFGILKTFLNSI